MLTIENYELVLSGENEEKLLLTFDWADAPGLPKSVSSVNVNRDEATIKVVFEDDGAWQEVSFVNLPVALYDVMREFTIIYVVGLSDDVEMFSESSLTFVQ